MRSMKQRSMSMKSVKSSKQQNKSRMGLSQSLQPTQVATTARGTVPTTAWQQSSDYYAASGAGKKSSCNWKKITFHISLVPASLIIWWFYSFRGLSKKFNSVDKYYTQDDQMFIGQPQYNFIKIVFNMNVIDMLLTIIIIMCSVAMLPGLRGRFHSWCRLLLPIFYIGSGCIFLPMTVEASYKIYTSFKETTNKETEIMEIAKDFIYAALLLLLTVSLLTVAVLWFFAWLDEFTVSDDDEEENAASVWPAYQQQQTTTAGVYHPFVMTSMPPIDSAMTQTATKKSRLR